MTPIEIVREEAAKLGQHMTDAYAEYIAWENGDSASEEAFRASVRIALGKVEKAKATIRITPCGPR